MEGGETIKMNAQEVFNGLSMIPGILMSLQWMKRVSGETVIAMIGYTITCICSCIYHLSKSYDSSYKFLKVDLVGQNVGLMCAISQTVMGRSSFLLLLPLSTLSVLIDTDVENERHLALLANALNIILTCCWSVKLCMYWIVGFAFFATGLVFDTRGIAHLMWHAMCHITVNKFFGYIQ